MKVDFHLTALSSAQLFGISIATTFFCIDCYYSGMVPILLLVRVRPLAGATASAAILFLFSAIISFLAYVATAKRSRMRKRLAPLILGFYLGGFLVLGLGLFSFMGLLPSVPPLLP